MDAGENVENKTILEFARVLGINDPEGSGFAEGFRKFSSDYVLSVDSDTLKIWAHAVRDYNRIHLYPKYAQEMRLQTSPVHGTLIAAHAEQYVNRLSRFLSEFTEGKDLKCVGQSLGFKRPLYVNESLEWNVSGPDLVEGDLVFSLEGRSDARKVLTQPLGKQPNVVLSSENSVKDSPYVNSFLGEEGLIRQESQIGEGELIDFHNCLGIEPTEQVPFMYAASFVPTALLDYVKNKTGRMQGIYQSQRFVFGQEPQLGDFDTQIVLATAPEKGMRLNTYTFHTIVRQDGKIVVSGEVVCSTPKGVDLD